MNITASYKLNLNEILKNQKPMVDQASYCDSNIMKTSHYNSLIAAANPLISLVNRIKYDNRQKNDLSNQIWHELRAYESALWQKQYDAKIIYISRVFLYAWIDEVRFDMKIQKSYFVKSLNLTHSINLVAFNFLEQLSVDYEKNKEVLEFCYLCISMGYVGIFRLCSNPLQSYYDWENKLYRLITHHEKPTALPTKHDKTRKSLIYILLLSLIITILLINLLLFLVL